MAITQEFDLNLTPNSAPVVVHVDQYDHGTGRLVANLYDGSTPYAPASASVYVQGTKPDGKFFVSSTGVSIDENVVTADLTSVMTQVSGRARVQFVVTEQSGRTGSFAFYLEIQKSALPNDSEMSDSDISMVEEAIETMQGYVSDAAESATEAGIFATASSNSAEDSEAWAVGTRNGEAVPSTDPTYHNNSKYWAEHGGGGSGDGHIIMDSEGNDMPQRASLQFDGMEVQDDSTHGITIVKGGAGGSKIVVSTTESTLHGKAVTVSDGTTTLTSTFNNSGIATFSGVALTGNLTISATDGTDTATTHVTIPYFGNYTASLTFWSATINVTTTTDFFDGLTAKAVKGGVVMGTATFSNGAAAITVPEAGDYTIRVDYDYTHYTSSTVTVSSQAAYSVTVDGFKQTVFISGEGAFGGLACTIACSAIPTQTLTLSAQGGGTFYALQPGTYTFTVNYQGTDYSVSQVVGTSGPYTVQLQRWSATINFSTTSAGMNGKTITIYNASEAVVGTTVFQNGAASFAVHAAGTYSVSCVVDGHAYTDSVVVTAETTYSVTLNTFDATINITTTSSDLYSQTITIKKGATTVGTTAFSAQGSASYTVHETGTYKCECSYGGETYESGNVVVTEQTTYSTTIDIAPPVETYTVTVDIYSAASDTISYTDDNGAQTVTTDNTGKASSVTIVITQTTAGVDPSITFTSSVAKDPDNLSNDYTKAVTITEDMTEVYVMPDKTLYWWGYNNGMEDCSSTNGWSISAGGINYKAATFNTRDMELSIPANGYRSGVGSANAIPTNSWTKSHLIITPNTTSYFNGGEAFWSTKDISTKTIIVNENFNTISSTNMQEITMDNSGNADGYLFISLTRNEVSALDLKIHVVYLE